MASSEHQITSILHDWSHGDPEALGKLMPIVFDELRRIAAGYFEQEAKDHTLQPTALVNEVYLKLVGRRTVQWKNRAHFFGSAAELMRRVLVDHARGRKTAKRGSGAPKISLDESIALPEERDLDLIALDDALKGLAEIDPRQSRIVELRFFAGLTVDEIAEVLGISPTTVKREWKTARVWLFRQIKRQ
ncbi:MAG: sigma-70 family RNA polymerase sigma factor [bacterium]|nr:sigma-70 family RNA polymerase sigma factor [bacterium]